MASPSPTDAHNPDEYVPDHDPGLQELVNRLGDPVQVAYRNEDYSASTVKRLHSFLSTHVVNVLGKHVFPRQVEAELLVLCSLFQDHEQEGGSLRGTSRPFEAQGTSGQAQGKLRASSGQARVRARLAAAKEILDRLSAMALRPHPDPLPRGEGNAQHVLDEFVAPHPDPFSGGEGNVEEEPRAFESASDSKPGHAHRVTINPERVKETTKHSPPSRSHQKEGMRGELPHEIDIRFAKGVGPKRAALLEKLGIRTIEDALWFLPWRYEDRSHIMPIGKLVPDEKATIAGTIHQARLQRTRRRSMTLLTMSVRDDTGAVDVVFFNQPYLESVLKSGLRVVLSGPVAAHPRHVNGVQMKSPHYELVGEDEDLLLHVGRIVPIYHETRGLSSRQLRWIMQALLEAYDAHLPDPLPASLLERHHWPSFHAAIAESHFPSDTEDVTLLNGGQTAARRRLAFEECFLLQLALAVRQRNHQAVPGIAFRLTRTLTAKLYDHLPFRLTDAQQRVIAEIERDMSTPEPMNRLIQGDVGSGKTVVALHATLVACGDGYQAVLMAPTEILAEQHFLTIQQYLEPLDVSVALLTGGTPHKERARVLDSVAHGDVRVVVGTHALLEQNVQFHRLGLVVVDEQHKFGVLQRGKLRKKGQQPDVLVMTATPIPRTLAMTVYGDLNVSVIDGLPPGRTPIQTRVFRHQARHRAYELVRKEVNKGRQAYIVYPLVEESEKLDLEAAILAAERLQTEEFPTWNLGLLHGRMKSNEKAAVMHAFKAGEIHVLVATTVIEVGLDVPNATVMVIEHADRFGLAQLHQLRGRVGRGRQRSCCLLISSAGRKTKNHDLHGTEPSASGRETPSRFDPSRPFAALQGPSRPFAAQGKLRAGSGQAQGRLRTGLQFEKGPASAPPPVAKPTQTGEQRLKAMVQCSDGFAIAEQDLKIRGPGDMLGTRQWGIPEFRVADLVRDAALLERARADAHALVEQDPELSHPDHQFLKATMLRRWQTRLELKSIG